MVNSIINRQSPTTPAERIAYVRRLLQAIHDECNMVDIVGDDGKCNTLARVYGDGDDWLQIISQEPSTAGAWLKARQAR